MNDKPDWKDNDARPMILIVIVSIGFFVGRCFDAGSEITPELTFQAFAHLWCGFALCLSLLGWTLFKPNLVARWAAGLTLAVISIFELFMAIHHLHESPKIPSKSDEAFIQQRRQGSDEWLPFGSGDRNWALAACSIHNSEGGLWIDRVVDSDGNEVK